MDHRRTRRGVGRRRRRAAQHPLQGRRGRRHHPPERGLVPAHRTRLPRHRLPRDAGGVDRIPARHRAPPGYRRSGRTGLRAVPRRREDRRRTRTRPARRRRPRGRPLRHHLHLRHHRTAQGRHGHARADHPRLPGVVTQRPAPARRPLSADEPVLPHLRLQGGHPRLPPQRRGHGSGSGVRPRPGARADRAGTDQRADGTAHALPHPAAPPRARGPGPHIAPARRTGRRYHRARADRGDPRRTRHRVRLQRLRAHRVVRRRHHVSAGRTGRAHRPLGGRRAPGHGGAYGPRRRKRGPARRTGRGPGARVQRDGRLSRRPGRHRRSPRRRRLAAHR